MNKPLLFVAVGGLCLAATACSDRTVTSAPTVAATPAQGASRTEPSAERVTVDAAQLDSIDSLLRDIEADLRSVDADIATPEGDPSE